MNKGEQRGVEIVTGNVLPEWIDVNKHMNVAYYVLVFDQGVDDLWERFGITENHINTSNSSTFAVESHITWQRELVLDAPYVVTSQLLAYDRKGLHQFMRLYHAEQGYLSATAEWLNLHIDLDVRRVRPWPDRILKKIAEFAALSEGTRWPDEAGKSMLLPDPIYSIYGASK